MNTAYIDWRQVIKKDRARWAKAYATIDRDMREHVSWIRRKLGALIWSGSIPPVIMTEIRQVADYLGIDVATVLAAQVFYDEGWNACREAPMCGCTSLSTPSGFGRNLDYGYPENASELVYHTKINLDGEEIEIEGFAGLLGWVAMKHKDLCVSLNQAPCLRELARTRIPALLWFRWMCGEMLGYAIPSADGEVTLDQPPAADVLLHAEVAGERVVVEVHDRCMRWATIEGGKFAQANTYQLFPNLSASDEWEEDSAYRMSVAKRARSVSAGLKAASVEGWTIDTFMMRHA